MMGKILSDHRQDFVCIYVRNDQETLERSRRTPKQTTQILKHGVKQKNQVII